MKTRRCIYAFGDCVCQGRALFVVGLTLALDICGHRAQTPNLQTAVEEYPDPQDLKIQQLQDKLEEIQKELIELKQANSAQPETHHITTAKASVAAPNLSETAARDHRSLQPAFGAVRLCRLHLAQRQRTHRRYSVCNEVLHAGDTFGRKLHVRLSPSAGRHHRRIERGLSFQRGAADGPWSRRRLPLRTMCAPA